MLSSSSSLEAEREASPNYPTCQSQEFPLFWRTVVKNSSVHAYLELTHGCRRARI